MFKFLHLLNLTNIQKTLSQKLNLFFKIQLNNIFFNSLITIYNNLLINNIKTTDVFSNNAVLFILIAGFLFIYLLFELFIFVKISFFFVKII